MTAKPHTVDPIGAMAAVAALAEITGRFTQGPNE